MGNLIACPTVSGPMFKILRSQHSFMRFTARILTSANTSAFDMSQPDSQHEKELILSIILAHQQPEIYIHVFY